ncbi:hypothetical protein IVB30_20230 [Bradyrhizobium sp. 200]|uniref:hypothetical protein n=1 Tax=Bradyrhizobium sp. 200 TaxID=2782665 RepID=UPI001FFE6AB9|nr:hypothetical protein [Bradyrhizobium sp. 200]UPJ53436.1 hypothetical protein IVB30_20230 [Bradyrhizobium sp. 200]
MGFIIWYRISIKEAAPEGGLLAGAASLLGLGLPVDVSNDPLSGSFILDADIKLAMKSGASASSFDIELINLPADTAALIRQKHQDGIGKKPRQPLHVEIHLGYFDDPSTTGGSDPVMVGAVMAIENKVGNDGLLRTRLRGQELGGYALRTTPFSKDLASATTSDFLDAIASSAGVTLAEGSRLSGPMPNVTVKSNSALEALRQLAEKAQVPLVIRDQKILIGPAVGRSQDAGPDLTPDDNIVALDDRLSNEESFDPDQPPSDQLKSETRASLQLSVLGDPRLRVGQQVAVKNVERAPSGPLRIQELVHHFSTKSGYTCDVEVVAATTGGSARGTRGVTALVDRWRDVTEGIIEQRPAIDVGQIRSYASGDQQKHLATLDYATAPPSDAVAPSVAVAIKEGATQLRDKPVASPFAWHKCGLMVPVYPGMRAVLAHNRGLVNDAIVNGFVWAENPLHDRPKNHPGDYWLCLPTQLGPGDQPVGKGVNDLTDKGGYRVIQAKGLRILVSADGLPSVGERPDPPADTNLVIEHESGTVISIDTSGAISISTKNKDLSFSNGAVTMKLSGASVEVT